MLDLVPIEQHFRDEVPPDDVIVAKETLRGSAHVPPGFVGDFSLSTDQKDAFFSAPAGTIIDGRNDGAWALMFSDLDRSVIWAGSHHGLRRGAKPFR